MFAEKSYLTRMQQWVPPSKVFLFKIFRAGTARREYSLIPTSNCASIHNSDLKPLAFKALRPDVLLNEKEPQADGMRHNWLLCHSYMAKRACVYIYTQTVSGPLGFVRV